MEDRHCFCCFKQLACNTVMHELSLLNCVWMRERGGMQMCLFLSVCMCLHV